MQLLLGLVSAYRYEGARVNEDLATEEAKALAAAVRAAPAAATKLVQNEQVVRVLVTRSKPQLGATFRVYMELHGKPLEEVVRNKHDSSGYIIIGSSSGKSKLLHALIPLLLALRPIRNCPPSRACERPSGAWTRRPSTSAR